MSLLENKEYYTEPNNAIFELAPFPMWIYDLETFRFLAVNQEAVRQYGYSKEELLRMTIKDIRPIEEVPRLKQAVEQARRRTEIYKQSLYKHQKKNGQVIYVKIKSNLINYQGKKAEIVTAIDLTTRYEQEKFIEKQSKFINVSGELNQVLLKSDDWRKALNQCFQKVGKILDIDRIYFFENIRGSEAPTKTLEWIKENTSLQYSNATHFQELKKHLKNEHPFKAKVSEISNPFTKNIFTQCGLKSTFLVPVTVNSSFYGLIGLEDYTIEKTWTENEYKLITNLASNLEHTIKEEQSRNKLKDNELRFKSLLLNNTDMITIMDAEANYTYASPNLKNILGIASEDIVGKNAFDLIHKNDLAYIKKYHDEILKSDQISLKPYRVADSKGNWHWLQTELTNHLNTPAIKGVIANSREVTANIESRIGNELVAAMTSAIGQPGALSECLNLALKELVKRSYSKAAEFWLISSDHKELNLISHFFTTTDFKEFYKQSDQLELKKAIKGEGLPGILWHTKETQVWKNLPAQDLFLRKKEAKIFDEHTIAIGLPVFYNHEFLGCFICYYDNKDFKLSQKRLLKKAANLIGPVVKQKATEEEYRNFFDVSSDPHCVVGFDGFIKKKNKALRTILGYDEGELLNKPIFNFIHPEDVENSKKQFKNAIASKTFLPFETRFITKDNDVRWLIWSGAIIPESRIFVTVGKDITEQKIAKQELNRAFKRLKSAQKIAKLGYWSIDLINNVTEWNEETFTLFGYTPKNFEPTPENIAKTFHPDEKHLYTQDLAKKLEPGKPQSFKRRILTANGNVKWVHEEMLLLTNKKGKPIRIEGTVQDITESKKIEQNILMSNERFKLAMKASNEMIWDIDHINKKITRSDVYKHLFDYELEEHMSNESPWLNIIHPEDFNRVNESFKSSLDDHKSTYWQEDYRIICKDGSIAYVTDRSHIIRDKNGRAIRSVGSVLDITASRTQLELIKRQNKNLRDIAWTQSHVLRAPLSRIMGLIYLYKEFGTSEKSIDEILNTIDDSAQELDKVIHEITEKTNSIAEHETRNIVDR